MEPSAAPPPAPLPAPRRRPPWRGLIALGAVIVALVAAVDWARDLLRSFDNPFAEETVDRTQPPVLNSIQDIGEYRAAAGNYQVVVDLEKDTRLPSELLGERRALRRGRLVDAGLDLSPLDERAVAVSEDGRAVTIALPHATLYEAEIDLDRSYSTTATRGS